MLSRKGWREVTMMKKDMYPSYQTRLDGEQISVIWLNLFWCYTFLHLLIVLPITEFLVRYNVLNECSLPFLPQVHLAARWRGRRRSGVRVRLSVRSYPSESSSHTRGKQRKLTAHRFDHCVLFLPGGGNRAAPRSRTDAFDREADWEQSGPIPGMHQHTDRRTEGGPRRSLPGGGSSDGGRNWCDAVETSAGNNSCCNTFFSPLFLYPLLYSVGLARSKWEWNTQFNLSFAIVFAVLFFKLDIQIFIIIIIITDSKEYNPVNVW